MDVVAGAAQGAGRTSPAFVGFDERALAADLVAAMAALGHDRFAVAGHDRGGRVAYRMALDHPLPGRGARRLSRPARRP